jgi:drug/metabolite transporter (DMT)-like permease
MRPSTLVWVWLAQGIGGSTPALTKLALDGIGPFGLTVARQILGAGFLFALAVASPYLRGGPPAPSRPWSRRDWVLLLALSWGGFALPQVLGAIGLTLSTATHGALLSPLEPIGILLGAALVLREPLGLPHALAAGLGLTGTLMIVVPSSSSAAAPGSGHLGGDLLMAAGHLSWAVYTLAAKSLVARHDPLRVALRASVLSVLPLLPLALFEPFSWERALPALGWLLLLALLASGVATLAWNRALREVSAGTMAIFVFVQPAVGLAVGVWALGEPAALWSVLGATMIVVGVALATLRGERVAPPPAAAAAS